MTSKDRDKYRERLPYDHSKFFSTVGPKKSYEHKFQMKYSYKNLDDNENSS